MSKVRRKYFVSWYQDTFKKVGIFHPGIRSFGRLWMRLRILNLEISLNTFHSVTEHRFGFLLKRKPNSQDRCWWEGEPFIQVLATWEDGRLLSSKIILMFQCRQGFLSGGSGKAEQRSQGEGLWLCWERRVDVQSGFGSAAGELAVPVIRPPQAQVPTAGSCNMLIR